MGDEYALMAVVKYDAEEGKLLQLPYQISADSLSGNILFFILFAG